MPTVDSAAAALEADLRSRDDESLTALLRDRPDLISPVPASIAALARRAASAASASRALDGLDRRHLEVAEVLAALGGTTSWAELAAAMGLPIRGSGSRGPLVTEVKAALLRLRHLALATGPADSPILVHGAVEAIGSHPAGLGPSADRLEAAIADAETRAALWRTAPDAARALARRLSAGPPVGRGSALDDPGTPAGWLLANRLVARTGPDVIVMPREVGLELREGRIRAAQPAPAWLPTAQHEPTAVEAEAAARAQAALTAAEDLLADWAADPPGVLRSGGIGVRDVRRAAERIDVDEATVLLLADAARSAGLITVDDDEWRVTVGYDLWSARAPERRWVELVLGWLASTRPSSLAGEADPRGKPMPGLSDALERPAAPGLRSTVLAELAALPVGAATDEAAMADRLSWLLPRRHPPLRDRLAAATLAEAATLGVTGRGAAATPLRLLLTADADAPDAAAAALDAAMPARIDHVLIQADLTAIAPGPLTVELRSELGLLADVESTGGATVYRFSATSLRRAFDAGRGAAEVRELLHRISRTPVPQSLEYLVDDTARRHGAVRVTAVATVIRSEDEAALVTLLAAPEAGALRLRRIAPTVLISPEGAETVRGLLADAGITSVEENLDGVRVLAHRRPRRAETPVRSRGSGVDDETLLAAAVRSLRAGDRAARTDRGGAVRGPAGGVGGLRQATVDTLAALRSAASAGQTVWIGYVDDHGVTSERVVDPLKVSGSWLTAFDHGRGEVATFAAHRITGVAATTG